MATAKNQTKTPVEKKEVAPKAKVEKKDPIPEQINFNTYEARPGFSYSDVMFISCLTMTIVLSGVIIGRGLRY